MNYKLAQYLSRFLLLTPIAGLSFLVADANQYAQASADGCSGFGTGFTCIFVKGDGLTVNSVRGSFNGVRVCNWRYDLTFTNLNSSTPYLIYRGPTHTTCDSIGTYVKNNIGRVQAGELCAKLYENNRYRDAACISITP